MVPATASRVLKFDPSTEERTLIGPDLAGGGLKWAGAVDGGDGCVYGVPNNRNHILRIDVAKQEVELMDTDLSEYGDNKWQCGALANGSIYFGKRNDVI